MLPIGLAGTDPAALGISVVECWDAFLSVVESADPERPSRLPGWTGHDVCVHLGSWPEHRVVEALLGSATDGARGPAHDADATNAHLVALYRDASRDEAIEALRCARDDAAGFFASKHPLAAAPTSSPLGPLPVSTVLHEVPGLPGGAALRAAVVGLGGVTKVLSRFRRS